MGRYDVISLTFGPFLLLQILHQSSRRRRWPRYFLAHHWLDILAGYAEGCAVSLLASKVNPAGLAFRALKGYT